MKLSDAAARAWALLFARLTLGLIFFMAGVYKVFTLTPAGHVRKWFLPFQDTFLPTWSLWAVGLTIPFVELVGGALLLVGWRIRTALLALGFVLVVVTFGHLVRQPLYPFHEHVVPRLALLLFLLAMPSSDDRFSVDGVRAWDRQIEKDMAEGKLDSLAEKAVASHKRGESREL